MLFRTNYQIFHFCEMTRMIQAQSASLVYFFQLITKAYKWIKEKIGGNIKEFFIQSKMKTLSKIISLKMFIDEFFNKRDIEDEKLRTHIKALDFILKILIFISISGIFLKIYK